ncbi:MFS transporter [Rhodococcus sp. 06-235-1A]|uniref:MFS transporter n=2 Tax=unclassified Rhodococcus (in: high G+C Gram-positive bacteria) TaxID=192944 RepID=UPI000B047A00|nr:MFS transporter [Rhodococcus sp. 06-235-1A]
MSRSTTPSTQGRSLPRATKRMLYVTWLVATLEGFDLAIYGATVPVLLQTPSLGMDRASAGTIGSLVGVGMLVGAAFAGAVMHRFGPRRLLLGSIAIFTVGMLLSTVATSAEIFGLGRLVVGLGLGVVLPTLNAYVADLSEPGRRARHIGLMMSGYAIGALAAPLLGAALLPEISYHWLYLIGVILPLVALPLMFRLPESPFHLRLTGRDGDAKQIENLYGLAHEPMATSTSAGRFLGLGPLLTRRLAPTTILAWVMSFCGLLLVFGISAWLPSIMQAAGYSLGSALMQTAAMWLGVFVGVIAAGPVADRFGPRIVVVAAFLTGTVSLILMSLSPPTPVLFVLMFVSGFGFIGSQILANAFILSVYDPENRSSALAWALSVGRLGAIVGPTLGAFVLDRASGVDWNFYSFAIVGLAGAITAVAVPRPRTRHSTTDPITDTSLADAASNSTRRP